MKHVVVVIDSLPKLLLPETARKTRV